MGVFIASGVLILMWIHRSSYNASVKAGYVVHELISSNLATLWSDVIELPLAVVFIIMVRKLKELQKVAFVSEPEVAPATA